LQKIGQAALALARAAPAARRVGVWRGLLCAWLCVSTGCSLGKLAAGQLSLINGQRELGGAIASSADPQERALLAQVPGVLAFAQEVVQLHAGKSYTGYFRTSRKGMTYVLTASERTRLAAYSWWFPVAGTVEYRSYFDEADARAAQAQLMARGYDTWVSPSRAYSTLGFFRDPVTTTMLHDGLPGLTEVLIHELAHVRLYVPGHTEWNEALATFVGEEGARRYFARPRFAGTGLAAQMQAHARRRHELDVLIAGACNELERLYGSSAPDARKLHDRQPVFDMLAHAVARLYPHDDPASWRMNNARLVHFRRYSAGSAVVTRLWDESRHSWRAFWALADAHARQLD
jgi:predicted aminopeptidase